VQCGIREGVSGSDGPIAKMKSIEEPVRIEQSFSRPLQDVWAAITDPDRMRQWFFENIPDFRPEVGFATGFSVRSPHADFPHRWKVLEAVPMKTLVLDWFYEGYAGDSTVTFALEEQNGLVRLTVTHAVEEDFADDVPEFKRSNCMAGWDYFIRRRLTAFLEGNR